MQLKLFYGDEEGKDKVLWETLLEVVSLTLLQRLVLTAERTGQVFMCVVIIDS